MLDHAVVDPPLDGRTSLARGETLTFGLTLFARALQRFDQCLWIQEKGFYRLYCDVESSRRQRDESREDGCHSGQLAGQSGEAAVQGGLARPVDDISTIDPLLDLIQSQQDRLYSRLFTS